jgi:hypothetical protein
VTIRRGEAWGTTGPRPAGAVDVAGDAAAARLVAHARAAGHPSPVLHLTGGDLWRTCGGTARRPEEDVAILPVDLGVAVIDGVEHVFVAHAVVRGGGWWRGRPVVAWMNAQYRGPWDVAPRAHPNDGQLDRVGFDRMPARERWKAWRRLRSGTHVPHPSIGVRRVSDDEGPVGVRVWLDGVAAGRAHERLAIRCEPDALTVCV